MASFGSSRSDAPEVAPRSISASQGGVRLKSDLVDAAKVAQVELVEIGMAFVLEHAWEVLFRDAEDFFYLKRKRSNATEREPFFYLTTVKVREADRSGQSFVDESFHHRPRVRVVRLLISAPVAIIVDRKHRLFRLMSQRTAI